MRVVIVVVVIVIVVTGGKQSQLLAFALGLGWSLTKTKTIGFDTIEINLVSFIQKDFQENQTSFFSTFIESPWYIAAGMAMLVSLMISLYGNI